MLRLTVVCVLVAATCAFPSPPLGLKAAQYAQKYPNTGPNPENGDLFEGDIELVPGEPAVTSVMTNLNRRWTAKTVYYHIDNSYTNDQVNRIEAAIDDLVSSTSVGGQKCVDIVRRTNQNNYVDIQKYSGCSSYIGMIGGAQRMSLVDNCVNVHGTIMHEFLHAMGVYHEQSRGDRDDYVEINFDNIVEGAESNFRKMTEGVDIDHITTGYDYGSVMHYGAYAFAVDPSIPTIIPHDPNASIGQRTRLSDIDIRRVQLFHCCITPAESVYFTHITDEQYADYCAGYP